MRMGGLFFSLIAVFLFRYNGNAQEINKSDQKSEFRNGWIKTLFKKEIIEYKYSSFEEMKDGITEIANEIDFTDSKKAKRENCEMIITIKVEFLFKNVTSLKSESINVGCNSEELIIATKKLNDILIALTLI